MGRGHAGAGGFHAATYLVLWELRQGVSTSSQGDKEAPESGDFELSHKVPEGVSWVDVGG